ncbi:MAG TPA: hypothetical protein VIG24_19260 [Acidimicrobiia bacterium]
MVEYEEHAVESFRKLLDVTQALPALLLSLCQRHRERLVSDLDVGSLEAGQRRDGLSAGGQDDEERGEESQMPLSSSLTT